jgi:predicted nucleic acid-binding protein
MEWLIQFQGQIIGLDTAPIIYFIILNQEHLTTFPVSAAIAERAAQLRASYHLRTPDAIQIATAIQEGATVFLTNDGRLPALVELEILLLNDLL